jgi:hypothetical protein
MIGLKTKVRFIRLWVMIICFVWPCAAFCNAYGIATYDITYVPHKQKLDIHITFDIEGKTEFLFPISFIDSAVIKSHIENLTFSVPNSRIQFKNNIYSIDSPSKEKITIKYSIKNPVNLKQAIGRSPYVSSEIFYLNNGFLIYPSVLLTHDMRMLLKSQIRFNLPSNNLLYSSDGHIRSNEYTDLIRYVYQMGYVGMKDTFFIGGSPNAFKIDKITTKNGPLNLLFTGINPEKIPSLVAATKKACDIENDLFSLTLKQSHIPFIVFIDNNQVRAINGGEFGENFHKSIVYFLGKEPTWVTVVAHEYIHNWLNSHHENVIKNHALYKWFFEGFTEYYAWKTTLSAGLINIDQAIARSNFFNGVARLNPLCTKSYLEIASAQYLFQISYQKGFLLASELDQRIIAATNYKYSLDDVMRSLVKQFQSGTKFTTALLKSEIKALAGSSFDEIFQAIEYGKQFTPTPTPFGIKTKLKYIPVYIPKYGFDVGSSAITQKVSKLDKSSKPYKAGIREGDFYPRDRNHAQSENTPGPQTVTLIIGTDTGEKTITYTTDSEKIMVPQYEIVE